MNPKNKTISTVFTVISSSQHAIKFDKQVVALKW